MKNWILGASAVAIIVGIVALLWSLQGESDSQAGQTKTPVHDRSAADDLGARTMVAANAAKPKIKPEVRRDDPELLRLNERTEEFERLLARDVPGQIREATAHCYDGSGKSYKQLENNEESLDFDYTLRLKGGVFTLHDIEITKEFGNKIDGCVKRSLAQLSWPDKVNPDFTMKMSDSITLLELKKWGAPMPHELEEVHEEPPEDEY